MSLPYAFFRSLGEERTLLFNEELEVSLTLPDGIPLKWSANGKLTPITTSTDRPQFILNGAASTSATGSSVNLASLPFPIVNQIGNGFNATAGPGGNPSVQQLGGYADVSPTISGRGIWKTTFVPVLNNFVSNTTGSPTSIIIPSSPATYGANAFQGGALYCKSLNQQVQITASSAVTSGNPMTLTIVSPLTQNADGLTFSATPLGRGMQNIQFSHVVTVAADGYVPSQLGVGSADWSSGFNSIWEVDIQNNQVYVIFQ